MSTLAKFGLWQEAQEPLSKPGQTGFKPPSADDETRADTGPNHVSRDNQFFSSSHTHAGDSHAHTHVKDAHTHGASINHGKHGLGGLSQQIRTFGEGPKVVSEPADAENMVSPASLPPAGELSTKPIAGDRIGEPEPPPAFAPPAGSLQARLVAVGATVNTYGIKASVRAPAGIPADLLHEVEARGWRVIPGGRANPEALHDSWLAGVPIRELER